MTRLPALAALLALALAAPAPAAVRVASGPPLAVAASGGLAYVVVGVDERNGPFTLVRTSGAGRNTVRQFGTSESIFPDVAASPRGRVHILWGRSISGGQSYLVASASGDERELASGSGPGQLFATERGLSIAHPDRDGNAAIDGVPLTGDAPLRRHLPLAAEEGLVLDMSQTDEVSELRVLGPDAPRALVAVAGNRRTLAGTMTVASGRIYVAYMKQGRAYLASAAVDPDAAWTILRLPGRGGGEGAAAVLRARGRTLVAYAQRGEIYLYDGRLRRLTRTRATDADAFAATDGDTGRAFVAWTRRSRALGQVAMVERVR